MDVKKIEAAAKTEALGWLELTEDPVPVTWAGCKAALIRAALGFVPLAVVFLVLAILKFTVGLPEAPL